MQVDIEIVLMPDPDFPIKTYIDSSINRNLSSQPHNHKEVELIYIPKGEMTFTVAGNQIVLNKNKIIFINSFVVHSSEVTWSDTTEMQLLQFDPNITYNTASLYEYKYLMPFMSENDIPYYIFEVDFHKDYTALLNLMREILIEFQMKSIAYEISIKAALYKILTLLYRNEILSFSQNNIYKQKELLKKLEKVLAFVERNYFEDISVEDACNLTNFNYSYFCRLFREASGKSFIEYLNFVRVSVAEKLMLTTDKSITDIIGETGFSSMSYFNRVFKSVKGVSPSSYRKANSLQKHKNNIY